MSEIGYNESMQLSDVEKLAELSRLQMSFEEKEAILKDLQGILGYVDQIQKAPVLAGEGELAIKNIFREDENPHEAGIYTERLLAEAPDKQEGYMRVKKIL